MLYNWFWQTIYDIAIKAYYIQEKYENVLKKIEKKRQQKKKLVRREVEGKKYERNAKIPKIKWKSGSVVTNGEKKNSNNNNNIETKN